MNDTPTPITDGATFEVLSTLQSGTIKVVRAELAQRFEKEIAADKEKIKELQEDLVRERIKVHPSKYELEQFKESAVENSRFVIQLLKYAYHGPNCPMPSKDCDCGLKELRDKIESAPIDAELNRMNLSILASDIVRRVHKSPDSAANLEIVVAGLIRAERDRFGLLEQEERLVGGDESLDDFVKFSAWEQSRGSCSRSK